MKQGFRQTMAWLHTWAGLLPGWLLFVVFLFGSAACFRQEISGWMRPELSPRMPALSTLDEALVYLRTRVPDAESWSLSIPSGRGGDPLVVSWDGSKQGRSPAGEVVLDPATGREIGLRDTRGGEFLYRFHFDLHYLPYWLARYLVSIAAFSMLIALLTGTIVHKKIFSDFFLLRLGKGQRSWLDMHNVAGVLALPFHLMITYTGLVTLLFTLMPWAIAAHYRTGSAFYKEANPQGQAIEASGRPAPMLPVEVLIDRAETIWRGQTPGFITIRNPGDATSVVEMRPARNMLGGRGRMLYLDATTGELAQPLHPQGAASVARTTMVDLHTGLFARPALRWLYFLSGCAGTMMIGSGLLLWTAKRRGRLVGPEGTDFGFRLVESLNIGVVTGAPAGIAVYFLANRLLPTWLSHRADWEINSLFAAWGAFVVWPLARPASRAWMETLAACAGLYLLVPVVNALTTMRGFVPSLIAGDWVFAGFDLAMIVTASGFTIAAWKVAIHRPRIEPRRPQVGSSRQMKVAG